MLDMKKEYETQDGNRVKLFTKEIFNGETFYYGLIYLENSAPLTARFDKNGESYNSITIIKEVNKYKDYKIDDPVLVYDDYDDFDDIKYRAYFAGVNENNKPTTFPHGTTSWTTISNEVVTWNYCMRVTL